MRTLCALMIVLTPAVVAADKNVGTWKLVPSKSSGLGDIVDRVMKVSQVGPNKFHYEFETRTKDGKVDRSTDDRVCDGKEHASVIDSSVTYTCEIGHSVFKRGGKPYLEYTGTFSPDGKTLSNSVKRWDKGGKPLPEGVNFFERQ
jgi:hypothetical protein